MKKDISGVCPGCSRHCSRDILKCKYGREYFAKLDKKQNKQDTKQDRSYKWEAYTEKGGLAWLLLLICRNIKKALRSHAMTEAEIFAPLSHEEKAELAHLVQKLNFSGNSAARDVSCHENRGI